MDLTDSVEELVNYVKTSGLFKEAGSSNSISEFELIKFRVPKSNRIVVEISRWLQVTYQ